MKQEALIECGLTKNEAKVYLALLKLGSGTAMEITKKSKVHRVNTYDVLERLRLKGLISSIMQSNKKIYEAANPEQLSKLIKQKEEMLSQIMPSLREEFTTKKEKQQVRHFLGPEGVMQAYYMMLNQDSTLYGIGGSGLNRTFLKHRHEMFNKERLKKGVKVKAIYYEFTRERKVKEIAKDKTQQIKFIPDKFKSTGMIDICGDLVVNLLPIEGNVMAIVIENKVLAQSYRNIFNFMWIHAKD